MLTSQDFYLSWLNCETTFGVGKANQLPPRRYVAIEWRNLHQSFIKEVAHSILDTLASMMAKRSTLKFVNQRFSKHLVAAKLVNGSAMKKLVNGLDEPIDKLSRASFKTDKVRAYINEEYAACQDFTVSQLETNF